MISIFRSKSLAMNIIFVYFLSNESDCYYSKLHRIQKSDKKLTKAHAMNVYTFSLSNLHFWFKPGVANRFCKTDTKSF